MNSASIMILFIAIFIITFIFYHIGEYGMFWKKLKDIREDKTLDGNSRVLLLLVLSLIIFGLSAPFIFTGKDSTTDFHGSGEIGDTFGGLSSPFINIAAVIVTGLAFYMQYQANLILKQQIEFQKFESKFYEMLRLHKENVNEIEIERKDNSGFIKGREAFFEMKKELEVLLTFHRGNFTKNDYMETYKIFFWGVSSRMPYNFNYGLLNLSNKLKDGGLLDEDIDFSEKSFPEKIKDSADVVRKAEKMQLRIHCLKGHHSYLEHYFRHLYLTIKFVINQKDELITEEEKLNYLRILRAQLSNYEQIMIFYNWLSGYGATWEDTTNNNFFTKFKMIHNLWYNELYKNDFVKKELKNLVKSYKKLKRKDQLFEAGDDIENNF